LCEREFAVGSDVSEFSINSSSGALTLINTYTVGLGEPLDTGALWISFDPTGKRAYIGTLAEIAQFTVGGLSKPSAATAQSLILTAISREELIPLDDLCSPSGVIAPRKAGYFPLAPQCATEASSLIKHAASFSAGTLLGSSRLITIIYWLSLS
jgi:hypothetical protein